MGDWFFSLQQRFINDFIVKDRWHFIVNGLGVTLRVTIMALILGLCIGTIVAVIRCAHDQQKDDMHGAAKVVLGVANTICKVYLTVIRGTPAMVQLLIMYFIILISVKSKVMVATLTFGINSGAYIAEIVRGGIMGVDPGQMEAGRSLGLNYATTMIHVVIPQALKSVFPAMGNEMITLLKETSICGYIGLNELTRGGDIIRGTTYDALLPLFTVAAIYLVMVMMLTWVLGRIERRMRANDKR